MKATLTSALCSLVVCLSFGASSSYAQPGSPRDGMPPNDAPGRVFLDQDPGHAAIGHAVAVPFGPWMSLTGNFGDGIGWTDGYVNATAFAPLHINPGTSLMYSTLNLGVAENGRGLLNVGSGYRYFSTGLNRIFGFAGFFDIDDGHEEPFYRVGGSIESLGKYLDYRLNTYYVVGHDSEKVRDSYITSSPYFQSNFLMLLRQRIFENAYSGADFEVGGQVPFLGRYGLSAYVGPYFLHHEEDTDAFGVKARIQAQINEDLTLGLQFSNDDTFSNNTYVNLSMTIPDGRPSRWFRPTPLRERLAAPVYREQRIAVHRREDREAEPLINPADNQPFLFAHIDPNQATSGNGTVENPYNSTATFVNSPAYDVVYVRNGPAANLNTGFVLFNNQRLLSRSVTHTISGLQGTFQIPGFEPNTPLPVISNPGGATVVQVANNNEVSGFQIDGTNGVNPLINGITSQPGGIANGFNFNRNAFTNNDSAVDLLVVGSGLGRFTSNTLIGAGDDSNRGFAVTAQGGGTVLNLLVANNVATGYTGPNEDTNGNGLFDGGEDTNGNGVLDFGTAFEVTARIGATINANAPNAAQPLGILNNIEFASGTGLLVNGVSGGVVNAVIQGNQFNDNVSQNTGIRIVANTLGSVNFDIDSNEAIDNAGNGIGLLARNFGVLNGTITNNLITNNELAAVLIDADEGFVTVNAFTDNDLDRATAGTSGIFITALDSTVTINNVLRNQFTAGNANSSFGIGGTVTNGNLNLIVGDGTLANSNVFDANGDAGIGFTLAGNSVSDIRVLRNLITNTTLGAAPGFAGDGIRFNLDNDAALVNTSTIQQNTITGHAGVGIGVLAQINSSVDGLLIDLNDISNNGDDGINFTRQQQANITNVFITQNVIDGNGDDGIDISAANASTTDTYQISNNTISNNTGRGIGFHVEADADLFVNVFNNGITDNGSHGIQNTEAINTPFDTRSFTGTFLGNLIARNDGNGIFLNGVYDVQIGADGTDAFGFSFGNTIEDNDLAGIFSNAVGDAFVQNNIIRRNGAGLGAGEGAGIDIDATLFVGNDWIIDNNVITANFGDGIELLADTAGDSLIPRTFLDVEMTRNIITLNDSRGVDILNRGDAITTITFGGPAAGDGNLVSGNGEEGYYAVLTASNTQAQNVSAGTALAADGDIDADGRLDMTIQNNDITGNGLQSGFNTTGLLIRVGTTDSSSSDPLNGRQFASDLGSSGVTALVDGNVFTGNQGNDVWFGSFVSTVNPPDTEFDPMARFDMIFSNNTVGSLNALAEGAAYTNASTVKSSLAVFTSTSRPRNATLLPATLINVATTLSVVDDTPTAGAVAPTANRFQSTPATNGNGAPVVAAGLYNSLATNPSQFNTRFTTGANGGLTRIITTYAAPVIGGVQRSDFTGAAYPIAPAVGDNFQVDYLRVPGIGVDTSYASPAAIVPLALNNGSTFRVQLSGNAIGAEETGFGDAVENLNPLQNGDDFDRPWVWAVLP